MESQVLLHQSAVKAIPHRHTHWANLQRPWLSWHYSPPARGFRTESSWQAIMTPTKGRRHPVRLRGSWDQARHHLSELSLMNLPGPFMWDRGISWAKDHHTGDKGACGSSLIWDLLTFSIDFNKCFVFKGPPLRETMMKKTLPDNVPVGQRYPYRHASMFFIDDCFKKVFFTANLSVLRWCIPC